MDQLLTHWLKIRPEERRTTALLFVFLFTITSYVIVGRAARDALLLSRMGISRLPWMYVGIAVASSATVLLYNRVIVRWNPATVLRTVLTCTIAALMLIRLLIAIQWQLIYPFLYVLHEVAGSILVVLFWTYANESFTTREAKRLFGIIGSGGVMAGTVFGFGGAWLAPRLGTANLLLVCVVMLLLCLLLVSPVRTLHAAAQEPRVPEGSEGTLRGFGSYAKALGLLAVMLSVAASLIDFQFKALAQGSFGEDALASFFGIFYGCCGLLSFFLHLLLTGRLLTQRGILPALLALPGSLLVGTLAMLLFPTLGVVIYLKASDATLRYSLNETCLQLLYFPIPVSLRRRLKALIEGGLKPLAIGVTGIALMFLGSDPVSLRAMSALLLLSLVVWIVVALGLRHRYVSALLASLTQRSGADDEVPVTLSDMASSQALLEALRSKDESVVSSALELLPAHKGGIDWRGPVLSLLEREGRQQRLAALTWCQAERVPLPKELVGQLMQDADPEVRAQTVSMVSDPALLRQSLADKEPSVQARAVVGLVRNSVDAGARAALEHLERMRTATSREARLMAAWVMGELGVSEDGLKRLLQDRDPLVQREAIEAVGKAQLFSLVPQLVVRLRDRTFGEEAAVAMGQFKEAVLSRLLELLPLPEHDDLFRQNVYIAFRGIGTRRTAEALLRQLPSQRLLRHEVLTVIFQILRSRKEGALRLDQIRSPLFLEVQDCFQWWAIALSLKPKPEWELLTAVVLEEASQARARAFLLLALVYPVAPMQALQDALHSKRARQVSNALELMGELLDGEVRNFLEPLVEDLTSEARVARGQTLFPLVQQDPSAWFRYFLQHGDRWLKMVTLDVLRQLRSRSFITEVKPLLHSPDAAIRESALSALLPMLSSLEQKELWQQFQEDRVPAIRRTAQAVLRGEGCMISSVEKVLFLKRVELFSQLPSRELLNLASIAEQVDFSENAVLMEEGTTGDSLYLILSGRVEVRVGGRAVAQLGPRECVGEMAILDSEPRSATVIAKDQVSTLRIERESFFDLLSQKREIALGIIQILVSRLRGANVRRA